MNRVWQVLTAAYSWVARTLPDKLRGMPLLLLFALCFVPVLLMNPAKIGLTLFGVSKLGLGAYIGYWVDRLLFPYARPHTLTGIAQGTAWKRRALIVAASIIAAAFVP